MSYYFIFGNTPDLSLLELKSVLNRHGYKSSEEIEVRSPYYQMDIKEEDLAKIVKDLGGTVKIAKPIAKVANSTESEDQIVNATSKYLTELGEAKIDYGLSLVSFGQVNNINLTTASKGVKRKLTENGVNARFVLPKNGRDLSSVVVAKQRLTEILILNSGDTFSIAETLFVQDFESWNKRDYDRPAVDPHVGMLPPKIGRMMANIALASSNSSQLPTILDPFCGVGTILAEGIMVGSNVIGSDVSSIQVENSKKNLEWLFKEYQVTGKKFELYQSDARSVSSKIREKIDAVVTEPDLGPNNENGQRSQADNLREKLSYLYLSSLEDWKKILKPNGKVVMVIPTFAISKDKELDLVKMVLDRAKIMGYHEFHRPIEYYRPQAVVRRNICFLTYGTH